MPGLHPLPRHLWLSSRPGTGNLEHSPLIHSGVPKGVRNPVLASDAASAGEQGQNVHEAQTAHGSLLSLFSVASGPVFSQLPPTQRPSS
jgi:hypothetical protein